MPDSKTALEELNEDATPPNPVHLREMLFHARLRPEQSLELNPQFAVYQEHFGEALKAAKQLLANLADH